MALSENTYYPFVPGTKVEIGYPVAANANIKAGSAVVDDAGGDIKQLVAETAGFRGFAAGAADNTGGSDGDLEVAVAVKGIIEVEMSTDAITKANVGDDVEMSDDGTFRLASAIAGCPVGKIVKVVDATAKRVYLAFDATA